MGPAIYQYSLYTIKVIIFDNRGIDNSIGDETGGMFKILTSDTHHLIQLLGIDHAHILRYSIGSMIALELCSQNPEVDESLVLYGVAQSGNEA